MIVVIQSVIAAALAFATSVGLHERLADTPAAPISTRIAFDAAGVLAVANALASLLAPYPPGPLEIAGAAAMLAAALLAWSVALLPPHRS